jgi:hypothetical protein
MKRSTHNDQNITPAVLDNEQAATYLGLAGSTLTTWRCTREVQIPFVRLGRRIVYRLTDLDAFLAANIDGAPAGRAPRPGDAGPAAPVASPRPQSPRPARRAPRPADESPALAEAVP